MTLQPLDLVLDDDDDRVEQLLPGRRRRPRHQRPERLLQVLHQRSVQDLSEEDLAWISDLQLFHRDIFLQ